MTPSEATPARAGAGPVVVVIGEALLDIDVDGGVERISPDGPAPVFDERRRRGRPGGAALAAVNARAALGDRGEVRLLTAPGDDPAGRLVQRMLHDLDVTVHDLGAGGSTPQKIRLRSQDQTILRLDRGRGPDDRDPMAIDDLSDLLADADAILVADYGLGLLERPTIRRALRDRTAPIIWDPHPRSPAPVPGAAIVTPNLTELGRFVSEHPDGPRDRTGTRAADVNATVAAARRLRRSWSADSIAVTRGADGALFVRANGPPVAMPAPRRVKGDPCGAGDVFAATLTVDLARGGLPVDALEHAVAAATAHVAEGGSDRWWRPITGADAEPLDRPSSERRGDRPLAASDAGTDRHRSRDRTPRTVAAGGCFDLLHAGHVATLRAARELGDRLVVLLNSDRSVRRLKGPDRPLQGETDRRAVLLALDCVDDVIVFDEDTPVSALERLRPDLFVKGGDYTGIHLDEADVLAGWGGEVVTVPYLRGRSTTRLVEEARRAR